MNEKPVNPMVGPYISEVLDTINPSESVEVSDKLSAQCIGCFALAADRGPFITPQDIADCREIPRSIAQGALKRHADQTLPLVFRNKEGVYGIHQRAMRKAEVPADCWYEISDEVKEKRDKRSLTEKLHDAAVITCVGCIALRTDNSEGMQLKAKQIMDCHDITKTPARNALHRIASLENPPISIDPDRPKSGYILTVAAAKLTLEDTPGICRPSAIKKNSRPRNKPTRKASTVPAVEGKPATMPEPEQTVVAKDTVPMGPNPEAKVKTTIAPQVCPTPKAPGVVLSKEQQKNDRNLRIALQQKYITHKLAKNEHVYIVGSALQHESPAIQQALLHVLGLDTIIYGKQLNPAALQEELCLQPEDSLATIARLTMYKIDYQRGRLIERDPPKYVEDAWLEAN